MSKGFHAFSTNTLVRWKNTKNTIFPNKYYIPYQNHGELNKSAITLFCLVEWIIRWLQNSKAS